MLNLLLPISGLMLAAAAPAPAPAAGKPVPAAGKPAPTPGTPLTGVWAGSGFALRQAPNGTVVQGACASGLIAGPVLVDKAGNFTAIGYYNPYTSGYRLSDLAPRDHIAYFKGRVAGKTLELTMRVENKAETHYVLKRDAIAKFARCK